MNSKFAVILAAGQGTRMKSKLYKVLHNVCGKPMVQHVIDQISQLGVSKTVTVIGHGADYVKSHIDGNTEFAIQEKQLGTAHAVIQASEILANLEGTTLVVCGDTPLLTKETLEKLIGQHETVGAKATILTAIADNPTGYGRIIRDSNGNVERIVEHKDASPDELLVNEINTGTYCFDNKQLFNYLSNVTNNNAQGEYYLPDVIEILKENDYIVSAYQVSDFNETIGVNDRVALAQAEEIMRKRINNKHMLNGVTFIDSNSTYISSDASIGSDTLIYPGTVIQGKTKIGSNCTIGPNTEIKDSDIDDNTTIKMSVVHDSKIGEGVNIGPFSHIRPNSKISDDVRIGNFVEIKKSEIGKKSKVSHLSYIGDSEIGKDVNVGCGAITVNYDGQNKYKTVIQDNAFVGCNVNLIAPVIVGEGAFVAAGSTITKDVPDKALSIARAKQVDKEKFMDRKNRN
ncbi:MAG: UDP-N-acetylglucosamine diphosphorylase/glucosamine-phosphate N-acetyltransferase [Bacillales bacterium]|jgi:bifunctional UDP-N-acetylglucosamine pyrophosphorylase/glucosamine-1-phosphate N-acetyltransferase|nr:UDP-N-acetylglucosamine diphosphorylase/glucosamine-phosphate N-acetyltransferase [Bacillales bacterium]